MDLSQNERRAQIKNVTEIMVKRLRLNNERFPDSFPLAVILATKEPVEGLCLIVASDDEQFIPIVQTAIKEIASRDEPDFIKEFSQRDN